MGEGGREGGRGGGDGRLTSSSSFGSSSASALGGPPLGMVPGAVKRIALERKQNKEEEEEGRVRLGVKMCVCAAGAF